MPSHSPFLFPPCDDQNAPFALRPLLIAGMVQPIVEGDGGINIAVVSDHAEGLLCLINSYLGMRAGDSHDIYWETKVIFRKTVEPGDVDKPMYFFLPVDGLASGWVEQCYYQLTRAGATVPDDPSVPLRLLVKLFRPGGRDREPHLPDGHSELKIVQLPPDLVDQGVIDAAWAEKGVPVTIPFYPDMTLRDSILLRWGSVALTPYRVTQAHVDRLQPIVIVVDQEAILAGGDGKKLEIKYDLYDETWNWAVRHSKRTHIDVDAGAWRLDAPIIKEAINGIITVKDLNKQPVTVQVRVAGTDFARGDTLTMTWIGTPFSGQPLIHSESRTIESVPGIVEINVPYEDVRAIAMGRADASYVLRKNSGGPPLSSKRTFADVVGAVVMLPEPTIRELIGDTLEPDTPLATVDVRYPGMANGDLINLIWLGTQADGVPYPHEEQHTVTRNEAEAKLISFQIKNQHIKVLDGGSLDLSYRVSNDNVTLYGVSESDRLLAKVQVIHATLPAPQVPEATNGVLDPDNVSDNVTVLVNFPGTHKDDILTYYWTGPGASTSDWIPITSLIIGKPVRFRLDARYVHANIGQSIRVRYSLLRAATNQFEYSAGLDLLIGEQVGVLPAPTVIQAADGTLNPMNALKGVDVRVSYPSMKPDQDIIRLKWLGTPGAGTSDDLELPGDASGSVAFHLPPTVVAANLSKRVEVEYEVKRHSRPTPSQTLDLLVSGFQNPETELPRPLVVQATGNVLDLTTFTGDATTRVPVWPLIALKQHVWLALEGQTSTGAGHRVILLDGVEMSDAQVGNGLNAGLLRSEVVKLGHATSAKVICKVAFDGGTVESAAIVFPVLELTVRTRYDYVTPTITEVSDSQGQVPEGGTTFDKQVTVKGTATRGENVALFDGTTPLGTADVTDSGIWSKVLSGLAVKSYQIIASALYDSDPVASKPRGFSVAQSVAPTIANVTDSKGTIAHGGTTFDRSVTVTGKASPNQKIRLRDGSTSLGEPTANASGDWSQVVTGLTIKGYSLTALALYGDGAESAARTFTVAQSVAPTIANVTDSKGNVAHGGTTFDRSVTVTGKASPNQKIRLRDGSTSLGEPTANASGDWSQVVTGLTIKGYSLTALALYGDGAESAARTFTVAEHIAPTLTSVRDEASEIPENGQTKSTTVTLRGNVTPNYQVQIYDNNNPKHTVTAIGSEWHTTLAVDLGSHLVKAKAISSGQESNVRGFTVISPTPPLNFNTSDVALSGRTYIIPDWLSVLPTFGTGTSIRHQASGGVPGYSYTSSNEKIAVVDSQGLVTVRGNGTASITARDSAGQSKSYKVNVTGVVHCWGLDGGTWNVINNRAVAKGTRLPTMNELREIYDVWGGRWPMGNYWYWAADPAGGLPARYWMKNLVTGAEGHVQYYGNALGVGIRAS